MRIRKARRYSGAESRFKALDFDRLEDGLLTCPVTTLQAMRRAGIPTLHTLPIWGRLKDEQPSDLIAKIVTAAALMGIPEGEEVRA